MKCGLTHSVLWTEETMLVNPFHQKGQTSPEVGGKGEKLNVLILVFALKKRHVLFFCHMRALKCLT